MRHDSFSSSPVNNPERTCEQTNILRPAVSNNKPALCSYSYSRKEIVNTKIETMACAAAATGNSNNQQNKYKNKSATGSPLSYPLAAFIPANPPSPCDDYLVHGNHVYPNLFPLHVDVLLALTRELLILEGTISKKDMTIVNRKQAAHHLGGGTLLPAGTDDEDDDDNYKDLLRKRKHCETSILPNTTRHKPCTAEDLCAPIVARAAIPHEYSEATKKLPSLQEILGQSHYYGLQQQNSSSPNVRRKVSDADTDAVLSSKKRNTHPSLVMINISLTVEQHLKVLCTHMTKQLLSSFQPSTIAAYCSRCSCYGSNNTNNKHVSSDNHQLLTSIISKLILRVSHAMFAWQRTEVDILSSTSSSRVAPVIWTREECDIQVYRNLFGNNVLQAIGGFDSTSLLPNALSIARLRNRGMSWHRFATSGLGRSMMLLRQHNRQTTHRNNNNHQQQKQPQEQGVHKPKKRLNKKTPKLVEESHPDSYDRRHRSSSASSCFDLIPPTLTIALKRSQPSCWNINLAKEGNLCVVAHSPNTNELQDGDIILTISDLEGSTTIRPGASSEPNNDNNWFKAVVDMFKSNSSLILEIRRVTVL